MSKLRIGVFRNHRELIIDIHVTVQVVFVDNEHPSASGNALNNDTVTQKDIIFSQEEYLQVKK